MAINLNDNINVLAGKATDARYLNNLTPYTSTTEANTLIGSTLRYQGLTVNVAGVEYWYKDGILDGNLVVKDSAISGVGITGATNGLTKSGSNVKLGGTLSENTTILGVTGGGYTLTLGDSTHRLNGLYSSSCGGYLFNEDNGGGFTVKEAGGGGITLCEAGGGGITIKEFGAGSILIDDVNGGSISIDSKTITGELSLSAYNSSIDIAPLGMTVTDGTNSKGLVYANNYCANFTARSLVDAAYVTGKTSTSGIQTASNGLTKSGTDVKFGGTLASPTTVSGAQALTLGDLNGITLSTANTNDIGLNAKSNGGVYVKSQSGTVASVSDFTDAVGIAADFNALGGFAIYDCRTGVNQTGIIYADDYSSKYTSRSLVDKGYVDSVATGLNVHGAVNVATMAPITLSGLSAVDGVTITNGMRVLVKDQIDGTKNGIYNASATTWQRSSDYNFNPTGEVANGDLISVVSGNTNANSQWVLVSPNPIVSGTTSLVFSLFSQQQGITEGNGICVTTVGTNKQIAVKPSASASGLCFDGTGLELDWTTYRNGLCACPATGKVDVRACAISATGSELCVKINTGGTNTLYIDSCDIKTCLGTPIITANNGLSKNGCVVSLGGALTGDTTISGNAGVYDLSFTGLDGFALGFDDTAIITDSNGSPKGLQYAADYGANFMARSLVDAAYVTGKTAQAISASTIGWSNLANENTVVGCGTPIASGYAGFGNTIYGVNALTGGTGSVNIAIGSSALQHNTTGGINIAIGNGALQHNTIGGSNIANGYQALYNNTTGCNNIANGYQALYNNTTGCNNIANGYQALYSNTIGRYNIANGYGALQSNTSGCNNIANGGFALYSNTTGRYNIANGGFALYCNISGGYNTANGYRALEGNTSGSNNTANGYRALYCNTTGNYNIANGYNALYCNMTGEYNIALGVQALNDNTTGCYNVANGYQALYCNTTGCDNIALGNCALFNNISGSDNIANGYRALNSNTSGSNNIANGYNALYSNTTGCDNIANGYGALYSNTTGCNTVAIGIETGYNNISGSSSIFIGTCAGYNETLSNKLHIANTAACTLIYGDFAQNYVTLPTLRLCGTQEAGATTDSVLVWNSSDNKVKTVGGTSLGDRNNIYSYTTVAANTTLTTGSTYVILANNPTSGITLTLPATPLNGQAFKLKDIGGNALVYGVTVSGNGKNIDGAATALINTSYGALEVMYDGTNWFSMAFIN